MFSSELIRTKGHRAKRAIAQWIAALAATSAAVVISFQWFDRPIASFAHAHLARPNHGIFENLTHFPDPLIPLAVIALVVLGLRALTGKSLSNYQAAAFVCSLSVISGEEIKDQLKFIFGRTWPESWTQNNPSFIRDGVYGFNFMHGGGAYQSFPSGHMAASCAVISVLWICYPRLRALLAIAGFAVAVGLVGANYHFLSDVIAGAFVGVSCGWIMTVIWETRARIRV